MSRGHLLIVLPVAVAVVISTATAGSKIGAHGLYMIPYGTDAKDVSRAEYGLGAEFIMGLSNAKDVLSGVIGLEFVNLMSRSVDADAIVEGVVLPYTKDTDQWYGRLRLGMQAGGLGNGFLRPYAGLNAALVVYAIDTDLDFHPPHGQAEFTEHKYDEIDAVFGYDLTLGLDLNISENVSPDAGVKYLKSFSVPDQLGGGSVRIYPQYFQINLGIGIKVSATEFE